MNMPTDLPNYFAPIVAATIAGAVAFLASVLSKELKTSEFRQAWIDALRNDLADLASLVLLTDDVMAHKVQQGKADELPAYVIENQDIFIKITACAMRIEMRLNPTEHQRLLEIVRKIGTATKTFRGNTSETSRAADELLEESQRVLKREWQRVKRGEDVFHFTKWASLWLLAACLVALLVTVVKHAARSAAS